MGLLKALVLLPLAPVKGVIWVAERITEEAERELYDPVSIRRQLEELELALEAGAIDEDEYERAESALLERLTIERISPVIVFRLLTIRSASVLTSA